jgi:hypothetical protein
VGCAHLRKLDLTLFGGHSPISAKIKSLTFRYLLNIFSL